MKVSLIATILNEEKNILVFLESLLIQTEMPYDVIIVDGGSEDNTVNLIRKFVKEHTLPFIFELSTKKGNRSRGRNEAISRATGDVILITDVGCILDKNWVKKIQGPLLNERVDVVAGYYAAKAETVFQKCLIPYVLVMPDRVNPKVFLPASRSMAISKKVWQDLEGFDERFSHNEDYVFARKLVTTGKKIVFVKEAIVYWVPRTTLSQAYTMFYRFALGDIEASIIRPKVIVLAIRYVLALLLLLLGLITREWFLVGLTILLLLLYMIWSISKNYRYVNQLQALIYLPLLQFTADFAVLQGSLNGLISRVLTIRHK